MQQNHIGGISPEIRPLGWKSRNSDGGDVMSHGLYNAGNSMSVWHN